MLTLDIRLDLHLETTEIAGKRHYICPDGSIYPSMTTVLSRYTDAQGGLEKWKKSVGEERAENIKNNAAAFGTGIHDMAEAYIMGKEPPDLDFFQKGRWRELKEVINSRFGRIYACETALYSPIMQIAGRTDVIGQFDGVNSVIDFKNSNKPKKAEYITSYWLQTCGYGHMYYELTKCRETAPEQLVIINTSPHEEPQVFIEPLKKWIQPLKDVVAQYV